MNAIVPYPIDHNSSHGRLLRVEFNFAENLMLFSKASHEWLGLGALVVRLHQFPQLTVS